MNRYRFVEAEKGVGGNVAMACELLEVSRSAFYDWHQHRPSARQLADQQLAKRIEAIFDDSGGTYGWPRVHRALRREGVHVGRARVARIMRHKGLIGRCRRPKTRTTISDPEAKAADLIKRKFGPRGGAVALADAEANGTVRHRLRADQMAMASSSNDAASRCIGAVSIPSS